MGRTYRIGTRASPLALKQVEEVLGVLKRFYPGIKTEIVPIETWGDKDRETPISDIEGSDFFTREIDEALLKREIDFAVHSAKDLPDNLREGLDIAAITPSIDPYDVLVSKGGVKLEELPPGAKIGTSSRRRKEGLKNFRPDFEIVDIRGDIEERLKLLDSPKHLSSNTYPQTPIPYHLNIDAIVIAAAGLLRLGMEERITQRIPFNILQPHPLQGRLAITIREKDDEIRKRVEVLNYKEDLKAG